MNFDKIGYIHTSPDTFIYYIYITMNDIDKIGEMTL